MDKVVHLLLIAKKSDFNVINTMVSSIKSDSDFNEKYTIVKSLKSYLLAIIYYSRQHRKRVHTQGER